MLAIERRKLILEQLEMEKRVIVSDLSAKYKVSEETIRRDLEKLEKEGFATKSYGGAVLNDDLFIDIPFNVRKNINVEAKTVIANLLAKVVQDKDRLMMDASSTAVLASKILRKKEKITVITNAIEIMLNLADMENFEIVVAGGRLEGNNLAVTGHNTEVFLNSYFVDKAIISCKGLSEDGYITDSRENLVHTKQSMLKAAKTKILLIDNSKFGAKSFVKICHLNEIDMIITDKKPDKFWMDRFKAANIELKYPL